MKATFFVLSLLALCGTLCAQPESQTVSIPVPGRPNSVAKPAAPSVASKPVLRVPRIMDPATASNMLTKTGGTLHKESSGPAILIMNTQTRVPTAALQSVPNYIQRILRLPCRIGDSPTKEPIAEALKSLASPQVAAVVVIGDAPGYPTLLMAPESRWALVNVAALTSPGVSAEALNERVLKETWRAFGYLMGAGHSTGPGCLLKPVFSLSDLDQIKAKGISPEPFGKISAHAQKLGIQTSRITSYRKAVEEGWAPAPTNDIQRAIWSELKKTPAAGPASR